MLLFAALSLPLTVCCGGCGAAGIDTLLDDMAAADPEWSKLVTVPGLLEPWNDVRDKWQVATDEFKVRQGLQPAAGMCDVECSTCLLLPASLQHEKRGREVACSITLVLGKYNHTANGKPLKPADLCASAALVGACSQTWHGYHVGRVWHL
jgi:hypothetical protein